MIVQTIKVSDCTPQTIVIGRRGTYDTLQIAFDLSYLVESYGNGVAVLAVKRSQDESAYPAVTSQEDDLLLWTVSETDTYYVGAGEAQLMWYVDGGLAKTIIYPMVVMKDILMTSEEAPDAYQEWVDSLIAEGAETLQNAQDAAQSASDAEAAKDDAVAAKEAAEAALEEFTTPTASATTLPAGYEATATYNDGNFAFGIPRGADGDPGDPGVTPDFSIGTVTTLEPTQPATATITGTAEAPVLNLGIPKGEKGDPGQGSGSVDSVNGQTGDVVLDAGDLEFDDTETYAAGSVGAELSQQKNAISQLDASLAPVETTSTASQGYDVGDLLVYQNRLYKVSSQIVAGGTLTIGTNIVATTVEAEIASGGGGQTNGVLTTFQAWANKYLKTGEYTANGRRVVFDKNHVVIEHLNNNTSAIGVSLLSGQGYSGLPSSDTQLYAFPATEYLSLDALSQSRAYIIQNFLDYETGSGANSVFIQFATVADNVVTVLESKGWGATSAGVYSIRGGTIVAPDNATHFGIFYISRRQAANYLKEVTFTIDPIYANPLML